MNRITIRQATLYRDGNAIATTAHDWQIDPNGSSAAPACAPNRCVWTRLEPQVAFVRDGREPCKECEALREVKPCAT